MMLVWIQASEAMEVGDEEEAWRLHETNEGNTTGKYYVNVIHKFENCEKNM